MSHNTASGRKEHTLKFVGLDVHKSTIAVAVADSEETAARSLGIIDNDLGQLRKLLRKIGSPSRLRVCYEAGPCGYVIYRFLEQLKINCIVVAPSLIPRKPGDRIKTDRRDASTLARLLRSGELTAAAAPNPEQEAMRDLVRAREDAVQDRQRARHRLTKFLLRLGMRPPSDIRPWTRRYERWLDGLGWQNSAQQTVFTEYRHSLTEIDQRIARFKDQIAEVAHTSQYAPMIEALQSMRGVHLITAVTVVCEVGDLTRFPTPRQLMSYAGVVPSECSSGERIRRGSITKCGNTHLRRALVESAWHCRHRPAISAALRKRQEGLPAEICAIAWRAQQRLHARYRRLSARGKIQQQVVVAVARELLAFMWAIGQTVRASALQTAA